jgi:hypothetical protein
MESWALSQQTQMPDYLHDDLCRSMRVLERIVLDTPQEKYTYGTPLLDAFTNPPEQPAPVQEPSPIPLITDEE